MRASQLYNARGKKLLPPPPMTSAASTANIAVLQTSNQGSNTNLKRRSQAASGVGGLKKSLHDQHQHSKSQSDIVLLRRDNQSLHSLDAAAAAQSQPDKQQDLADAKVAAATVAGKSGTFFKKLFQR